MGKKIILMVVLVFAGFVGQILPVRGQTEDVFNSSGLDIPRFVSLRSDKVFVRTGPALRYPIKWVYQQEGRPIEIIQEFDTWRKIKDYDGEEGWIHQSLLAGQRNAIIVGEEQAYLRKKPNNDAQKRAVIEKGNIARLEECVPLWCKIEIQSFSGWIARNSLWGVYDTEEFD